MKGLRKEKRNEKRSFYPVRNQFIGMINKNMGLPKFEEFKSSPSEIF